MNYIKFIRIFLLVLIVIGVGLLATQKIWVPKLVDKILSSESNSIVLQTETKNNANGQEVGVKDVDNPKPNTYGWCITNGGEDRTPNYNAPKVCVVNNKVYEENCVSNNKYFVVEKNLTDSVGANHLVKYKINENQNFSCEYVVEKGDFEIKNEWAEYTLALENNFLILDSGTGPDPRGLIIYDLNARKKVFEDTYSRPITIQNNTINYWTEAVEKATEVNCPELKEYEAGGLGAAIDAHVSLNLSNLIKKDLGERRCSSRQ